MSGAVLLDVDALTVEFPGDYGNNVAVDKLNFRIHHGETVALVGESGSGKSVTAMTLLGLISPRQAKIGCQHMLFQPRDGRCCDLSKLDERSWLQMRGRDIAMIFQEPMTSLNPVMTVGQQITEPLRLHQQLSRSEARKRAQQMLDQVRVADSALLLDQYPHQLSGGMRQRVMTAIALCCRPQLLIADEPTTALDVTIQAQILTIIRLLQQEIKMAVLFITHDMGVVSQMADRVVVMRDGRKVEEGGMEDVLLKPQRPYTRSLVNAVPHLGSLSSQDTPAPFLLIDSETGVPLNRPAPLPPLPLQPPILKVDNLSLRFAVGRSLWQRSSHYAHAVEKVSLEVRPGETLAIVGESGCGKSSLAQALVQVHQAQEGDVYFEGQKVGDRVSRNLVKHKIQYIFQDPFSSLNPRIQVGFSIAEPFLVQRYHSHPSRTQLRQTYDQVATLLEQVGMSPDHARRYPHQFSGGQRQRICIARALICSPKVLILDESVASLDVSVQAQIVNLLLELQQQQQLSYLFISHDMGVVERISHRVAVMYAGQIVETAPRRELFSNPQHPYSQRLLDAVPVFGQRAGEHQLVLDQQQLPSIRYRRGHQIAVKPLQEIAPRHYVAQHAVGFYSGRAQDHSKSTVQTSPS